MGEAAAQAAGEGGAASCSSGSSAFAALTTLSRQREREQNLQHRSSQSLEDTLTPQNQQHFVHPRRLEASGGGGA